MSNVASVASEKNPGTRGSAASPERPALRMPAATGGAKGSEEAFRLFHLAGRDRGLPPDAMPGRCPRPAVAWADASRRAAFPLFVPADGGDAVPLVTLLERAAAQAQGAGEDTGATGARVGLVARAAAEVLGAAPRGASRAILDEAGRRFVAGLDVSAKGAKHLAEEWERLRARIPAAGEIVGLSEEAVPVLALAALLARRRTAREAWRHEVERLARSLRELLRGEQARAERGAAPALGALAGSFLNPAALAGSLPQAKGPVPMSALERSHVEQAAARLEQHLAAAGQAPDILFVRPEGSRLGASLPEGLVRDAARPLESAPALFDELAAGHAEVLRAARLARLALAGTYVPEEHDPILEELDWRGGTPAEAMALPSLVVLDTADGVRAELTAFSRLLASDRPVHVVVVDTLGAASLTPGEPPVSLLDIALAHREAFVASGTLADPVHLDAGLRAMATRLRPAVVLATVPAADAPLPAEAWAALALDARLTPCLRHDPDAGETQADRFDLAGNPCPEEDWPALAAGVDGAAEPVRLVASWAALAVASPAWRPHVRVLAPESWSEQQVELHEAIGTPGFGRDGHVPFAWVVTDDGTLARAVVTRELMSACRDRARAWRLLRELAGVASSHARRAADEARAAALAEAEARIAAVKAQHEQELAALRENAAADTLDRLVSVLLNAGELAATAPPAAVIARAPLAAPPPAAAPAAPAPAPAAPAPAPAPAAAEAPSDEPYTDTVLCTTCNECIHVNNRMFKYNANKQATVADPGAGTYAELVKAAEKCPARCIHVGSPRPGDPTVNDALLARAKPFR